MEDRSVLKEDREDGWFRRLPPQTRVLFIGLAVLGSCHIATGPPFYYSAPIRTRVIDEHTGSPNGGVVAVALWVADRGWASAEPLYADEAVTDANGEFVIPAMWPRLRRPLTLLCMNDPEIWLYKPGYHISRLNNTPRHPHGYTGPCRFYAFKRHSYWNGKTIPLQPATTVKEQAHALERILSIASAADLEPRAHPNLWRAAITGYRSLPREFRYTGFGNPEDDWNAAFGTEP